MGFMDSLKEIGLGNTGRYGRMQSGATNYANYAKERQKFETDRGVNQALLSATKGGKLIDPKQAESIAGKWGMPYMEVMKRVTQINNTVHMTGLKAAGNTAFELFHTAYGEKNGKLEEKDYMDILGQIDERYRSEVMGMMNDYLHKVKGKQKLIQKDPTKDLLAVGRGNKIENLSPATVGTESKATARAAALADKKDFADYQQKIREADERPTESGIIGKIKQKYIDGIPLSKMEQKLLDDSLESDELQFYGSSISNGLEAVSGGTDPEIVYRKLVGQYSKKAKELKSIFLDSSQLPPEVKADIEASLKAVAAGTVKKADEYSKLAVKHSKYQKTIRSIMITPTSDQTLQAILGLFDK